ncbi:uncharacterized protein LOC143320003 [Chaetodon auriga]|uniref:uncharacterized protein LOC143320003 n=1 Tax=Chaetodon auriga TaxID=39042 RepID=UPI0040329689
MRYQSAGTRRARALGARGYYWKPQPTSAISLFPSVSAERYSEIFKIDNMAFQNTSAVALKEKDNVFLLRQSQGQRRHHMPRDYVKLIYSSAQPNKVSVEYGTTERRSFGGLFSG